MFFFLKSYFYNFYNKILSNILLTVHLRKEKYYRNTEWTLTSQMRSATFIGISSICVL